MQRRLQFYVLWPQRFVYKRKRPRIDFFVALIIVGILRPGTDSRDLDDRPHVTEEPSPLSADFDGFRNCGLDSLQELPVYKGGPATSSEPSTAEQTTTSLEPDSGQTPEEILEASYQSLQDSLANDVLEAVKEMSPEAFEQLVVKLLVAMGYGGSIEDAGRAVGKSGDEGIDGIIKEDKLGLDAVYIQAKKWDGVVGRPVVQGFAGSLEGHRARKGVMLTTSGFSRDAREYVQKIERKIVLIDGQQLAQLMIEHNVGVKVAKSYTLKKLDQDFFEAE